VSGRLTLQELPLVSAPSPVQTVCTTREPRRLTSPCLPNVPNAMTSAALAVTLLAAAPLTAQQRSVEYDVAFPHAEQHEARVTATFRGVPAGQLLHLRMSRSSPGRYAIHSFAKNVSDVSAVDGRGRTLAITRPDPHGWDVARGDGTVRISYTVFGDRTDGTYLGVDHSHAHINMPALFMWARGMEGAPIRLTLHPRAGWRIATQLVPTADSTTFTAPNLQWFMDSPTEAGPLTFRTWSDSSGGKKSTWRIALHHVGTEAQADTFAAMAKKVVAEEVAAWGAPAGYDYGTYTFLADYLPWASGDGMEHRNSTVITSRRSLATPQERRANLTTLSHEFFHSWNVERLRPRALEPFDFERENMSGELWFAEGFTSYFDNLFVRRAGYYTDDEYAAAISGNVNTVVTSPGRQHFSAVGMSMQAPFVDAAVSIDPTNRANTFISYYTWGSALGLALDLTLRDRFNLTLEDYMRAMWHRYGQYQTKALAPARPYTLADLRRVLGEVTRDSAFANDFFRRYVEGQEAPDFARLLSTVGFKVDRSSAGRPWLGASMDADSARVFVNWTTENGPAWAAGISGGDMIYAIDGEATPTYEALTAILARHAVGDVINVDIMQRGDRRTVPVTLGESPAIAVTTYEKAGIPLTEAMRARRTEWLRSRVNP
jgi:predicted metalloprotease with PDZ domain